MEKKLKGRKSSVFSAASKTPPPRSAAIDEVFNDSEGKGDLKKIERPTATAAQGNAGGNSSLFFRFLAMLLLAAVLILGYKYLQVKKMIIPGAQLFAPGWYQVTVLDNDEIFYGHISALSDPLVVDKVYYDYDKTKQAEQNPGNGMLRLYKAGKDQSGTDGRVIIAFDKAKYEPLGTESPVLKAILEYEK